MVKTLRRIWIPLVIIAVLAISGMTMSRVRTYFGASADPGTVTTVSDDTKPFDPKVVTYEIWGEGTTADINYLDLDIQPQRVDAASLPWSVTLQTTDPSVFPNIVAKGNGESITCRITVDGEVKAQNTTHGLGAQTFCMVKSA